MNWILAGIVGLAVGFVIGIFVGGYYGALIGMVSVFGKKK